MYINILKYSLIILIQISVSTLCPTYKKQFAKVEEGAFSLKKKECVFAGSNYWQGMNLGAPKSGDRQLWLGSWQMNQEGYDKPEQSMNWIRKTSSLIKKRTNVI